MRWRKLGLGGKAAVLLGIVVGCARSTDYAITPAALDKEQMVSTVLRQLNIFGPDVHAVISAAALDSVVGLSTDQVEQVRAGLPPQAAVAEPSECAATEGRSCLAVEITAYSTRGDTAFVQVHTWGVVAGGAHDRRTDSIEREYMLITRGDHVMWVAKRVLSVGVSAPPQ